MPLRQGKVAQPPKLEDPSARDLLVKYGDALRELQGLPLLDGHLIEDIELTAATREIVQHGLGRKLRGYVVVKRNAGVSVYDEVPDRPQDELWLQAASNVTISLWVF